MHRRPRTALTTLALGLLAACGGGGDAQNDTSAAGSDTATAATVPPASSSAGTGDQVMATLAASNAAEIEAGRLAADSATNADVKAFAQMMITDHTAMNEQAHAAGQQSGAVSQPGQATAAVVDASRDIAATLKAKKRGPEFDRAYMDAMVASHEQTLQLLDQSTQGLSPALGQAITQARPKVQQHLDRAKQIQGALQGR